MAELNPKIVDYIQLHFGDEFLSKFSTNISKCYPEATKNITSR